MVKRLLCRTGRMAGQALGAAVCIALDAIVFVVHVRFIVIMAADAGKLRIDGGVRVAVGTTVPFALVPARVNREGPCIVVTVLRGLPARVGGMALLAFSGKPQRSMIRIGGAVVVGLVAGEADRRGGRVIGGFMALAAVIQGMAQGQREKIVVDAGPRPGEGIHGMALGAVCRIVAGCMVRALCRCIVVAMAIVAIHPKGLEVEQ